MTRPSDAGPTAGLGALDLRALPKAELHCHLEGTVRPTTAADLALAHGVRLPVVEPADLYAYTSLGDFLAAFGVVCSVLQTPSDFHRIAYEACLDAAVAGIRYREMFFSPGFHLSRGVELSTVWDGMIAGLADGEADTGVVTRVILDIDKPAGLGPAMALLEVAKSLDRDWLLGVGGDSTERGVDHRAFAPFVKVARKAGLRTSFHCGEDGPAANIAAMVDAGVDRIDHGTHLLDDPDLTRRVIDEGIPLTSCPTSNVELDIVPELAAHPFARFRDLGVPVSLNSDDPAFFQFDLADEYRRVANAFGYGDDDMVDIALAGVAQSWLPADERADLAAEIRGFVAVGV